MDLKILYEDNHLIVVEKPAGILSQADNTSDADMLTIIKQYLKEKYNKPGNVYLGLVHRLDRMTGGVMVFAKTSKCASRLSEQIRNHEFEKKYLAIIKNVNLKKQDTLIDYISVDEKTGISKISSNGKMAKLDYQVIREVDNLTLVDIKLYTGRHHQIRIQFAGSGNPLYGDVLYGNGPKVPLSLYAYSLKFYHPITKELLEFKNMPKYGIWGKF
jgi:23S rRNA pseudouridine1911/1915/1917 synthase